MEVKAAIDHLPVNKQQELAAMTKLYREGAAVEQLILFGSYARGDFVEDRSTGYVSDYDLLVVVKDPALAQRYELWDSLEQEAQDLCTIPLNVIVHDIRELNEDLRRGHYFFAEIVKQGVVLYDTRRVQLARPGTLTTEERRDMARRYFDYWFASASHFWHGTGYFMRRRELLPGVFLLHQAAERYFHATTLVFTGYKSRTHNLEKLSNHAATMHALMRRALPRAAGEERRLFQLLKRAYIDARYSKSYRITLDELTTLRNHVQELARFVRTACAEELTSLGADPSTALLEVPQDRLDYELPATPEDLTDTEAVERWKEALLAASHEAGLQEGEQLGRAAGLQEGRAAGLQEGEQLGRVAGLREGRAAGLRESRASAILDVLSWRGVVLTDEQRERILECSDAELLEVLWQRARVAQTAEQLFADD